MLVGEESDLRDSPVIDGYQVVWGRVGLKSLVEAEGGVNPLRGYH